MSQVNARLVYRNALNKMKQAGVNPATAILSQSYLRLELIASATRTSYQFGVLTNDAPSGTPQRPTENRLNLQDAFYCSSVQLFTSLAPTSSSTSFSLDSYPNPRKYSDTSVATAMYNLYNGYMSLTVNNRVITPSWDLYRHLDIAQTQQNNLPAVTGYTLDQFDGEKTSAVACEPNWVLIGSKNNNFN